VKISPALAGVVLVGTSLASCSGSDDGGGSYCADIAAAKPVFTSLSDGDLTQLEKGFTTFHELADEAPDDIEDEWTTLDSAATKVEAALKEAGLTFSDLPKIQDGKIPEGVVPSKLAGFVAELQELNNSDFADARAAIGKQAKDSCDVDLGAS
jgi:hypothetical protein